MLEQLRAARRRGGHGLSIEPTRFGSEPGLVELALQDLLKKHGMQLTVELWRGKPMLCYRRDAAAVMNPSLTDHLDRSGFHARPGDEIVPINPFGL